MTFGTKLSLPVTTGFLLILTVSCSRNQFIPIPEAAPVAGAVAPSPSGEDAIQEGTLVPETGTSNGTTETSAPPVIDSAPEADPILESPREFFAEPHEAVGELASFYNRDTGLWNEGWKTSAFAIAALADYMKRTQTLDFTWILDTTFRKNTFVRENFEDTAAWGLAWLSAYEVTKETRYLNAVRMLTNHLYNAAVDGTCGGGLYAREDKMQKSAIANLLFIKLSASLYQKIPEHKFYLEQAVKTWNWLNASGLKSSGYMLKSAMNTGSCTNLETPPDTQTQGLVIGALSALALATQDPTYEEMAKSSLDASLKEFVNPRGILVEKAIPDCRSCEREEALFKGIFLQNASLLHDLHNLESLTGLFNRTSSSAWRKAKGPGGLVGFNWDGAFDTHDAARQVSAVFLLNTQITRAFEKNYAFNGDTRTSNYCHYSEGAEKAFDGSASTKWCGVMVNGINHLSVDLGAQRDLKTVRILHAGAGGEPRVLNTKDFELQISSNGSDFTDLLSVRDNESSMTYHRVNGAGRFLRLRLTHAGADNIGRIYEMTAE